MTHAPSNSPMSPSTYTTSSSHPQKKPDQSQDTLNQTIVLVQQALADVKAKNIVTLNVEALTDVADRVVIASGTSSRHVKALAANVVEKAKQAGLSLLGTEGEEDAEWILVDLASVVVHVMLPATRTFYNLESLWRDPAQEALAS